MALESRNQNVDSAPGAGNSLSPSSHFALDIAGWPAGRLGCVLATNAASTASICWISTRQPARQTFCSTIPNGAHILSRQVIDSHWNPHISRGTWIASTSNQKALVWDISNKESPIHSSLTKHLRAVSDLHWSPFHSDTLATCSYDSYIHLWDLRSSPENPSDTFCAFVGVNQVKFNPLDENLVATAHDYEVRIWDRRKGSIPTKLISAAHMKKIYGIDWSRKSPTEIVTCSQDQTVKVLSFHLVLGYRAASI